MKTLENLGYRQLGLLFGEQERYCFEHTNEDRLNINITLQLITKTKSDSITFSKIAFNELSAIQQFILNKEVDYESTRIKKRVRINSNRMCY
jgi:hypothetical protein